MLLPGQIYLCTAIAPSTPRASVFIATLVSPQYLVNTILVNYAVWFSGPRPWLTAFRAWESIRLRCICQPNPLPRIETGSSLPPFSISSPSLSASLFSRRGAACLRPRLAPLSSSRFSPRGPVAPPKNTKPVTRKPDLAAGFYDARAGLNEWPSFSSAACSEPACLVHLHNLRLEGELFKLDDGAFPSLKKILARPKAG